jgi:hypothetical protein
MIYQLCLNEFEKVRYLFRDMDHDLVISSILARKTPARIYVDNSDSPNAAATWFNSRIILEGNPDDVSFIHDLQKLFSIVVIPQLRNAGLDSYALFLARSMAKSNWESIS